MGEYQAGYGNSDCRRVCHAIECLSWPGSVIGLTRRPLKAETTGSIPVRATKQSTRVEVVPHLEA